MTIIAFETRFKEGKFICFTFTSKITTFKPYLSIFKANIPSKVNFFDLITSDILMKLDEAG